MIEIVLHNPNLRLGQLSDGHLALLFEDDASGITVTTAVAGDAAKKIAEAIGEALGDKPIEIADLDDLRRDHGVQT
jgi:hypothetical protein